MTTLKRRKYKAWWKKICIGIVVTALLVTVIAFPNRVKQAKADNGLSLFYTVTIEKEKDTMHLEIQVKNIYQDKLYLSFTNSGFHDFDLKRDTYLSNIKASTEKGTNLQVEHAKGSLKWQIKTNNIHSLTFSYDIPKVLYYKKELFAYINDNGGTLKPKFIFMYLYTYPLAKTNSVKLKLNLPEDWPIVVTPYIDLGNNTYQVPKITNNLDSDFINGLSLYFGKMKYYAEKRVEGSNCTVKYGVLENDEREGICGYPSLNPQEDIDLLVQRTAVLTQTLTKIFGENPYPVIAISTTPGYMINGEPKQFNIHQVAYWPPRRFDEMAGHLIAWWISSASWFSPAFSNRLIEKGIEEEYLGNKLAYKQTNDKTYLGKIYAHYLIYERGLQTNIKREEVNAYYKGCVVGLYLDKLIQNETDKSKSIEDVIGYLYKKYKNTGHEISDEDLKEAVNVITGQDNSEVFKKYVDGNEEIPLSDVIQPYKNSFSEFIKVLNSDNWKCCEYHGYAIPFLINTEIALAIPGHLPAQILIDDYYRKFAAQIAENYSIDKLTEGDVENVLSNITGRDESNFFEIWKDIYPGVTLENIKSWLKSYFPYRPQNIYSSVKNNLITINWSQVKWRYLNNYYMITGYNIYRGTETEKEEKLDTVTSNSYTDRNIEIGKTYYYYVTAVEDQPFRDGFHIESEPSEEIKVTVEDTTPPSIEINFPTDNSTIDTNTITVSGTVTDDLSGVNSLTINGNNVSTTSNGTFSYTANLIEGKNTITIIATDKAGNKTTKTITVTSLPVQTITITLQPDKPIMSVNGVKQEIDPGRRTKPVIIPKWSRTVVPIRAIVEALGGTISWESTERKVTINFNDTVIELWIDKPKAEVNGTETWIDPNNHDVRPIIRNDRTMLPLRFVAENLGCKVDWNAATRTITITYGG